MCKTCDYLICKFMLFIRILYFVYNYLQDDYTFQSFTMEHIINVNDTGLKNFSPGVNNDCHGKIR